MSVEEKAALIALVGVLVSALVSWLVSKKTIKYNYKELFAETVKRLVKRKAACEDLPHTPLLLCYHRFSNTAILSPMY